MIRSTHVAALGVLLAAVMPAPSANALVVPSMGVAVYGQGTSTWSACGGGDAANTGVWLLTVEGFRDTLDGPLILEQRNGIGPTFSACIPVDKMAPDGAFTVTLTFVGIGTDVVGTFYGYAHWGFGLPDGSGGSGIT